MIVSDLLFLDEALEPETIEILFPELNELDRELILTTKVIQDTNAVFEDMDIFENAVYVLNGIKPDITKTEGCTPEMLWRAIPKIKKINNQEFSHEVKMYIKHIFNSSGIYFYPELAEIDNPHLDNIKIRLSDETPLVDTKFIDIQAYHYLRLNRVV